MSPFNSGVLREAEQGVVMTDMDEQPPGTVDGEQTEGTNKTKVEQTAGEQTRDEERTNEHTDIEQTGEDEQAASIEQIVVKGQIEDVEQTEQTEEEDEQAEGIEQIVDKEQNESVEHRQSADQIDDASLQLILQLQMEDLVALDEKKKGKQREGEVSDTDVALGLAKENLEIAIIEHGDRQMCISIARAVFSDAPAIQACTTEEQQATTDRAMAHSLSRRGSTASAGVRATAAGAANDNDELDGLDAELLKKLEGFNAFSESNDASTGGESSSSWAATRRPAFDPDAQDTARETCTGCYDTYAPSVTAKAPCSHLYCRRCLNELFLGASVDETLFPPRCCKQPIPVDEHIDHLSTETVTIFRAKEVEFSTPNRVYCHRPKCSAFLPPQSVRGGSATCGECGARTCAICKGPAHENSDCPEDTSTQELLRVAKENGWQQCKSCRRLVELDHGCNHMSQYLFSSLLWTVLLLRLVL
ncbi:hypothetical protein JDV02_003908 [Purpureocillium takamizusanense]|uniref:RBR-type E3 ubiquitin transferase n=1 Tax=Purpureocillium takamizusanense TaxID=2060973 RepID=A0A9Q8QE76_9HYPO|nr:uncharacterized protein JDV02_003908 [Purpureocillium takamizusanense]UNI17576.1 hypothetical protein JDV02_003908 [Purpureocillium takamizusanense]